jgi:2-oxoglutarate ferredoxin oxidoreductase subunit alpha
MIVLAPASIQEAVDLIQDAFDLADRYRTPVMILADGMIGQMMEPIAWKEREQKPPVQKNWAALGREADGTTHFVTSLRLDSADNEKFVLDLVEKYKKIKQEETRFETVDCEGAEVIIAAFGTTARIALSAARGLKGEGIRVGLFRPVTLWPYPAEALRALAAQESVKDVLTVEMNTGQMLEDVKLALCGIKPTPFYGRTGGMVPEPAQVAEEIRQLLKEEK